MSAFTNLKGAIRRIVKLEKFVKYILAHCCDLGASYPEVDFIVDIFDRGDADNLGDHWSNYGAFTLRSGAAVSKKGLISSFQDSMNYVYSTAFGGQDNGTHCDSLDSVHDGEDYYWRRRRIVGERSDLLADLTFSQYKARLSGDDQAIEIGFTVVAQEFESSPPNFNDAMLYCWGAGYETDAAGDTWASIASFIAPALRYDSESGNGLVCIGEYGDTKGWSYSVSSSITTTLPACDVTIDSYRYTAPAISDSASSSGSSVRGDYVGERHCFGTFVSDPSGEITHNLPTGWSFNNGYSLYAPPYEDFPDLDPNDGCDYFAYEEVLSTDPHYTTCRCTTKIHVPSGEPSQYVGYPYCSNSPGCTYISSELLPTWITTSARATRLETPAKSGGSATLGQNRLKFTVQGGTLVAELNGDVIMTRSQSSVLSGRGVGMFAFGDVLAIMTANGLTNYPQIDYVKAWNLDAAEPSLSQSGHGTYDGGDINWIDVYHSKVRDADGLWTGAWAYDPLAQD